MKYFVWIFAVLMLFYTISLASAVQENSMPSTKPDFPESIKIGEKTPFSLKMSNLREDRISDIEPIITIMPKSASEFVHVDLNPQISTLWDGFYEITHGTIQVDKDIPVDRIFVSVSFMGKNPFGEQVPLSSDSTFNASIKIEKESESSAIGLEQPPIIIKQVELSSPLKSDPQPDCTGLENFSGPSTQWFELQNISDHDISIQGFTIHAEKQGMVELQIGPDLSNTISIKIGQKCIYPFHCANQQSTDQRCFQDTKDIVFTFEYNYGGKPIADGDSLYSDGGVVYKASTPPLTDQSNDAKTWQFKNKKWVFENMRAKTISPPLQQFKAGIESDVTQCREGLALTLKVSNNSPNCVRPQILEKLEKRGWTNSKLIKTLEVPLYTRLAKAQYIVEQYFGKLPITGVGAYMGKELEVTIHEDELKKNPNAKEYYEKIIKDMLPFDVPVKITFGHAILLDEPSAIDASKSQYGSCPVSFMDKSQYKPPKPDPDVILEPKPPITMMGTEFSSFEEAKSEAGLEGIFMPTYMPDCLNLDSIRVSKANPTGSFTTVVYLLDGVTPTGYFTENNVTENGVLISIQKERGIVYSLSINYVQDQARENKDLGWNYTVIKNSPVLLKNRNVQLNMPTEADLVFVHQSIRVSSKILDIKQAEKITRSMIEEK